MDTYTLSLFKTLAENLSFVKTSELCNLSPSALSRQIKGLEEELGCRLIFRNTRFVELSENGRIFLDYAREVLSKTEAIKNRLCAGSGDLQGEISLFGSVTACYALLPAVLNNFRKSYPKVNINLKTGDPSYALESLLNRHSDLSVAALPENLPKSLVFMEMIETPLVFISPAFPCAFSEPLKEREIPWERIPFILSEHGLARKRVDSWFRAKSIVPRIYAQVSGNEAILTMVALGFGVGVVPALVLERSPVKSDLKVLPVTPSLEPYRVGLCTGKMNILSPVVRAFWDTAESLILQEEYQKRREQGRTDPENPIGKTSP